MKKYIPRVLVRENGESDYIYIINWGYYKILYLFENLVFDGFVLKYINPLIRFNILF